VEPLMVHPRRDVVIRLIALFKLVKAAALIAVGVGAISMRHADSDGALRHWIDALAVDPHGKYLTEILAKLTSLHARELREIGVACLLYALVFVVEGIGLLGRRMWAEVMTVIVTISFIPLEIYELAHHPTWAKIAVIIINVLVALYLLRRLKREQHWPFHRPSHVTGK
jgi:uncharacterized membrane protein (DUF2068 family)